MDIKEIAKEIRAILKKEFPATKFSVTTKRFSMGESVETSWTDGPTRPQVDALIGGYGDTRFRFINTSRKHSIEFADKVINVWKEQNPEYAHFAITSQGKVDCYGIQVGDELYGSNDIRQDCEDSIYKFLRSSTLDSLTLATPPENTDCEPEVVSTPEPEAVEVATETAPTIEALPLATATLKNEEVIVSMKDALQNAWDKASAEYIVNPTPDNYRNLDEKAKVYELGYMLFGEDDRWITPQPQPNQLDLVEADSLEADRQQAYSQYAASQQEADALEAKLAIKRTEAQVYLAIMKEIDEQIEAKKRKAEVITTEPTQPNFDVRTLESKKVTLILINTMGFPVSRHITVIAADLVSAKRYQGDMTDKKCLELQYIKKGKRKPRSTRFTEADLAIALGWQQIEVPNEFTIFEEGMLDVMVCQAKDVVYTQRDLLR